MTPDVNALDLVINKTVHVVNQSKNQIFDISEQARTECDHLQYEIERLKAEVVETIKRGDRLERELTWARKHLAEVSREFESYNEVHIKEAYERANKAQSQMILAREQEKHLRKRRDDLQLRLQKLSKTVDKAEDLMTQMNVIMDYLSGDLQKVGQVIEDAKQQQKLGLEVIQAQEEERKRVAREIHDGPAQQMANVVLRTELVERMFHQQKDQEAKEELKYLKELVRESLAEVRRIIFDLRPMALDDLGLIPTLSKYIEVMNRREELHIDFETHGREYARLPSSMEVALFRFVQESLTNVIKHAQATHAKVNCQFQEESIHVVVTDNGIGFNPRAKQSGFGLMGLKERVKLLGGDMKVESDKGQGTTIMFTISKQPVEQPIH